MKMRIKTEISVIISIIAIILMGIFIYKVSGVTGQELSSSASSNGSLFWNDIHIGDVVDETGMENSANSKNWICFSHKTLSGFGSGHKVKCILDINVSALGKYSVQIEGKSAVSNKDYGDDKNIKKLAYLIYAASVDSSAGLVGDSGASPSKNALYAFFNSTNLEYLIGDFSKKRTSDYVDTAKQNGATILKYAETYANTETTGSSATISGESDSGAEVMVSASSNGTTYSYIGPFTMKTAGTISGVSIKDGNSTPSVAGYATKVGGTVSAVSGIPKNGNQFYIVTTAVLTNVNISVTINTRGTAGGGTVTNPLTGATSTGYVKARMIFMGGTSGQATAVFRGDVTSASPSSDSVTFTAKNNLGKMLVQKVGAYAGNESYENVRDFGFKLYYLDGTTKKYLRINDSDTISGKASVSIGGNSSYAASESTATTIFTYDNGAVTIDNISIEYQYYIEESNTDQTNYDAEIISATRQEGTGEITDLKIDGNTAGPITVVLKGANNTATKIMLKDYRKIGNLTIEKVDQDDYNTKLGNVQFRVKNKNTGYYVVAEETAEGEYNIPDQLKGYTQNEEDGTIFITHSTTGTINITGLDVGNYEIIEINNPNYGYTVLPENVSTTVIASDSVTATVENEKQTGNLRIEKKDADNDAKIQGVSFRLRKNISAEDQEALADFVDGKGDVNSNGYLEEEDLSIVLRYVTGKTDLTTQQQNAADVNGDGQVNIIDMRLLLRKIQSSGYVVGMQRDTSGNLTAIETATGTVHFDDMTTTNNPEEATIFVTDEEGLAQIYNILIGSYVVEEISVGDNFGYDVDPNFISWEVTNSDGTTTTVDLSTSATIEVVRQKSTDTTESAAEQGTESTSNITDKNRRKYIKIRGFAWEDIVPKNDKDSQKDGTWTNGSDDKRLANITVRLIDKDGNLMDEAITDANGEYVFGNYDEDTNAIKLEIDKLAGAYIEFEYNGMSYQSIAVNPEFNPNTETTSNGNTITKYSGSRNTATDEALREEFNNNYATISQGAAANTNGNKTYDIRYNYDAENHESHVIYGDNVKYGYDGQRYPISGTYEQYTLQAVTAKDETNTYALCTGLTPENIRQNAVVEIGGLNLGVEERQMPDLFVLQDMQDVQITFNDYTHTYHYAQRFEDPANYIGENVINGDNTLNVAVRFANKYIDNSYSREVYSADIVYNKQEGNEGKLKIFVTYKLQLTNESSSLFTNLKTLTNYYDARYENVVVRDENGNIIESQVDDSYNQNGLKKVNIQTNYQIPDGQTRELTITYQLNNDAINSILNQDVTLDSITEVSSYSTYSDSNYSVPYAGIDVDSAPDTVEPEIVDGKVNITDTVEDDTDKAPSLILSVKEGRIIQGTVWEDSAIEELLAQTGYNKERKGNGIYESTENVVNDVKVELMTVTDAGYELAELYQWNSSTLEESTARAETTTSGQGTYEFSGVIPSKYVLRYTYGDNSVIVDPNGNTVKNVDIDNYKSTIYRGGNKEAADAMTDYWYRGETSNVEGVQRLSDAKDTLGIMSDGRIIDNIIQNRNAEEDINYATAVTSGGLTEISADTRMFDIKLDYDINLDNFSTYADSVNGQLKFIFDNIDFGIIERPRQSLIVDKQVANIQIVLPNGNDLINGDPRSQNLSGVRVLDDDVYIEIDNEIIQGSTLRITYEISVDNSNCEIDYNNDDYYIYGAVPAQRADWKIATVVDMFDYLPEDLVLQSTDGNNWERIDVTEDMRDQLLAGVIYDEVEGRQNIIHLANPIFENMVPGSEAVDTSMVVSKQLSTSTDDMTYENDIEIVKLKGRKTYDSIPGNYNPTTNESYDPYTDTYTEDELDDDEVEVTITPPTGESRAYWIYGIIGISVLIIMGVGIVIIKKKVLKN